MNNYIVVVGTSAGGLTALKKLLSPLPKDFPTPILIVMHVSSRTPTNLPNILQRHVTLPISIPKADTILKPGHIYLAPSDLHMVLSDGKLLLEHGPKINHCRPAIDPLFFSAANSYGTCAIGVLLSGLLDDGSAGLLAIKRRKGITIVQDPEEAEYADMPKNALRNVSIDYCLETKNIAELLVKLVKKTASKTSSPIDKKIKLELKMDKALNNFSEEKMNEIGSPSVFACPACHGVLWEIEDEKIQRFRCRVGHAYSIESLIDSMDEQVENALWAALRALEEKKNLSNRVVERLTDEERKNCESLVEKANNLNDYVKILRSILNNDLT